METSPSEEERQARARSGEPAIEVNQIWVARDSNGTVLRQLRILAPHPDEDKGWIYEEMPVGRMYVSSHIGICPEFNLRYVFELWGMYE